MHIEFSRLDVQDAGWVVCNTQPMIYYRIHTEGSIPTQPYLVLLLMVCLLLGSCSLRKETSEEPAAGAGENQEIRIAAMAPAVVEILHVLGRLDLVKAVGDFVEWPPQIAELPRIGAYNAPNVEQVLDLGITFLVTAKSAAGEDAHRRLRELGVRILTLDLETYTGTLESMIELGMEVAREKEAKEVVESIRKRIGAVRSSISDVKPRRVLVVVGRKPLYVAGPGSHIDEIIRAAGGVNVFPDVMSPYQLVSVESAVERMPEVIIDASDNRPGAFRGRDPGSWGQWRFLPAVQNRRVYWIDPIRLTIPGPRLPEMAEMMGRLIHPEVFGMVSEKELGPVEKYDP